MSTSTGSASHDPVTPSSPTASRPPAPWVPVALGVVVAVALDGASSVAVAVSYGWDQLGSQPLVSWIALAGGVALGCAGVAAVVALLRRTDTARLVTGVLAALGGLLGLAATIVSFVQMRGRGLGLPADYAVAEVVTTLTFALTPALVVAAAAVLLLRRTT